MTSNPMAVVSLTEGAAAMIVKVKELGDLTTKYHAACIYYDRVCGFSLGDINHIQVTVKGKKAGDSRSGENTFFPSTPFFDKVMSPIQADAKKRVDDLYARIQKLKEEL